MPESFDPCRFAPGFVELPVYYPAESKHGRVLIRVSRIILLHNARTTGPELYVDGTDRPFILGCDYVRAMEIIGDAAAGGDPHAENFHSGTSL